MAEAGEEDADWQFSKGRFNSIIGLITRDLHYLFLLIKKEFNSYIWLIVWNLSNQNIINKN